MFPWRPCTAQAMASRPIFALSITGRPGFIIWGVFVRSLTAGSMHEQGGEALSDLKVFWTLRQFQYNTETMSIMASWRVLRDSLKRKARSQAAGVKASKLGVQREPEPHSLRNPRQVAKPRGSNYLTIGRGTTLPTALPTRCLWDLLPSSHSSRVGALEKGDVRRRSASDQDPEASNLPSDIMLGSQIGGTRSQGLPGPAFRGLLEGNALL